jgi:hypothetical protein
MTNQHPITPPPELVSKWCYEDGEEIKSSPRWFFSVCAKAAQWGADQELEACCGLLIQQGFDVVDYLCAARRPKPPSLAEQALALISHDPENQPFLSEKGIAIIRRALERLQELENNG